eukprot:g27973.t1
MQIVAINGDDNPLHFPEHCKQSKVVLRLRRRRHDPEGGDRNPDKSGSQLEASTACQSTRKATFEESSPSEQLQEETNKPNLAPQASAPPPSPKTSPQISVKLRKSKLSQDIEASEPCDACVASVQDTLRLLTLPPDPVIATLTLGLDPASAEHFNKSVCKMKDIVASLPNPSEWPLEHSDCEGSKAMYYDFDWKEAAFSSRSLPVVTGVLYLLMVFILPRFVPAGGYKLDRILVVHNLLLSAMSLVLCVGCAWEMFRRAQSENTEWMFCENPETPAQGPLYFWSYAFYVSKYYELVDTLLAILRASRPPHFGLHVYHHALVPVMVWNWLEYRMNLQHIGLLWNTFVHVVMYAYYGLKVLKIPTHGTKMN